MDASVPRAIVAWLTAWGRVLQFTGYALAAALSPSSYTAATRQVAARQIYFTAWQILLPFTLFMSLFSLVLIEITLQEARDFGLSAYALQLILRALPLELVPLLTALFVALRSGAAIATEVALMRFAGELDDIHAGERDPLRHELVPRVAAAALSVVSLTLLNCALSMGLTYVALYGFSPWGFEDFTRVVGYVFGAPILAGFALKCLLFGTAVAVIPIAAGLEATRHIKSAPVSVVAGMVRLFFVLGLIEVASLAGKYV